MAKNASASSEVEEYDAAETARRRDAALLCALNTPPKPHSEMKVGRARAPKAADSCVAIVEKAIAANRRYRRKAV
jgi:hypothetical protein